MDRNRLFQRLANIGAHSPFSSFPLKLRPLSDRDGMPRLPAADICLHRASNLSRAATLLADHLVTALSKPPDPSPRGSARRRMRPCYTEVIGLPDDGSIFITQEIRTWSGRPNSFNRRDRVLLRRGVPARCGSCDLFQFLRARDARGSRSRARPECGFPPRPSVAAWL
jgi:hypothetical protein